MTGIGLSEMHDEHGRLTHMMCCFCFRYVPVDQLWVDENGKKWDSCGPNEFACEPANHV